MAEQTLNQSPDDNRRAGQPPAWSSAADEVLPGSQGTNTVRGTWSSEGEAGRHHRLQAGSAVASPTAEPGTPSPRFVLPRLDRIAERAQRYPDMAFTTLAHHLDVAMLERAFWGLNPRSAAGVDRVTGTRAEPAF